MKKTVFTLALFSFALVFTSCRDAEKDPEKIVIEKEVEAEPTPVVVEDEGLLEEAAEEVSNEVDEEVSEEIQKIGDDK